MGNVQGRKHKRKRKHRQKQAKCDKLIFVDRDDGEYVWETHVVGRLPLKEPEEPEIVFHCDKLWQEDDGWSMVVLIDQDDLDANELSDVEVIEI
jgi:hypothetical protein